MSLKTVAAVGSELGGRFNLLATVPGTVFATTVAALVGAGAPGTSPDVDQLGDRIGALSGAELVVLSVLVVIAGLIIQPFQLTIVRLLEGYWGSGPVRDRITAPLVGRQRSRRRVLADRSIIVGSTEPSADERSAVVEAAWRLRHEFPPAGLVLPTALGNVLRAAEYRAGRPYGLDAVVVWPRLYPILPPTLREIVDDLRLQLDVAARFSATFAATAVVTAGLLFRSGWWLTVPLAALLLAWASYRAAVAAAEAYGVGVEAAFDLHHLSLRKELGLTRPTDRASERIENRRLTDLLRGLPTDLVYDTADGEG